MGTGNVLYNRIKVFQKNNTRAQLIKNINSRMTLIRNMKAFGATKEELVHMWIVMCRSKIEQSCVLWHSSLTQENSEDLERTQKTFTKLVLQEKYKTYEQALLQLNLNSLAERRRQLCLKFAQSGEKHGKLTDLLIKNEKSMTWIRERVKYTK